MSYEFALSAEDCLFELETKKDHEENWNILESITEPSSHPSGDTTPPEENSPPSQPSNHSYPYPYGSYPLHHTTDSTSFNQSMPSSQTSFSNFPANNQFIPACLQSQQNSMEFFQRNFSNQNFNGNPAFNQHFNQSFNQGYPQNFSPGFSPEKEEEDIKGSKKLTEKEKKDARRQSHSALEKRRREDMKDAFSELQKRIPGCHPTNTKAIILRKASEYIDYLSQQKEAKQSNSESKESEKKLKFATEYISCIQNQKAKLTEDVERLKNENSELKDRIKLLVSSTNKESPSVVEKEVPRANTSSPESLKTHLPSALKVLMVTGFLFAAFLDPIALSSSPVEANRKLLSENITHKDFIFNFALGSLMFLIRSLFFVIAFYCFVSYDSLPKLDSRNFILAQLERKTGKEYFLEEESYSFSDENFRKALKYLGSPLPQTTIGLTFTLLIQITRQIFHMIPGGLALDRFITRKIHDVAYVTEIGNNYYLLSQEFFSTSNFPLEGWVCLLRALNLAESTGNSQLLVNVYATLAFQVATRLTPLHGFTSLIVARYWGLGVRWERVASMSKKAQGWTTMIEAWGKTAFGELDSAARKFEIVANTFEEIGWSPMTWQAWVFKSVVECIKGDFISARDSIEIVKSKKSGRASPAFDFWTAVLELGVNLMTRERDPQYYHQALQRVRDIKSSWTVKEMRWYDTSSLHLTVLSSFTCIIRFMDKDPDAINQAEQVLALCRLYTSHVLFSGTHLFLRIVSEVLAGILRDKEEGGEAAAPWQSIEYRRIESSFLEAITAMRSLCKFFMIISPTSLLYRGIYESMKGNKKLALNCFSKGLVTAEKHKLKIEQAQLMTETAVLTQTLSDQDYDKIMSLIDASGSKFHLESTRKLLSRVQIQTKIV